MGEERNLLVGYDLENEYTQISLLRGSQIEPETVSNGFDKQECLIPTALCIKESTKEWLIWEEAKSCRDNKSGFYVDGLFEKFKNREEVELYGTNFSADVLLERFFRKTLGLIKQKHPNNGIKLLVLTIADLNKEISERISEVLSRLNITKERVRFQSRTECFAHFVFNQKKELWASDVGLFQLEKKGLRFYLLGIKKDDKVPSVVVQKIDLYEELGQKHIEEESKERLAVRFGAISGQIVNQYKISVLYVTGQVFEGNWSDDVLRRLCYGRRVFKGQNLYTRGACYAAQTLLGEKPASFLLLTDDMIVASISLKVYQNAKEQILELVRSGTYWKEAKTELFLILDKEDSLTFLVNSPLHEEPMWEIMTFENMVIRENKTVRILLTLAFLDRDTAVVTVRDTGFGNICESSHRIWEQVLRL